MVELKDRYDVIVIGAGMGGLTCGTLLARQGKSVLICERHITPGGNVCGFKRKGFTFDAIHFLMTQCDPGETMPEALKEMGVKDAIKFIPVEQRNRLILPGLDFTFTPETFVNELKRLFPAEAVAIEQFTTEMTNLINEALGMSFSKPVYLMSRLVVTNPPASWGVRYYHKSSITADLGRNLKIRTNLRRKGSLSNFI